MFGTWTHEGQESCAKASSFVVKIYIYPEEFYRRFQEFELIICYFFFHLLWFVSIIKNILRICFRNKRNTCICTGYYSIHSVVTIL